MPVEDIKWALSEFAVLANRYKVARDYYNGDHRLAFASEKFRTAFGALFNAFADNLMPTVVETLRDRLKIQSFDVEAGGALDAAVEIWRRNRMAKRASEVHLDSLIEGDSYLVVWPDAEGFPVLYPNRASRIVIQYDSEQPGYIIKAAKAWITPDKLGRITLYYRDRIEKYITRNKVQGGLPTNARQFIEHQDDDDPGWPLDNPYDKVPVFHFGNRTSVGELGKTELKEAMPLQDALNKSIADMLVGSEFFALPQRYATGLEDDLTAEEAAKRYKLQSGGVWGTTSTEAKFGEFSAGDLNQFITVINDFRREIARVSRTPLHYFTLEGNMPSGESMKTADGPLAAKVEDRQTAWGMVWGDVMRFALEIAGKSDLSPEVVWADTTPRNETEQIANAVTKVNNLSLPVKIALKEIGYSDKQIEDMEIPDGKVSSDNGQENGNDNNDNREQSNPTK